MGTHPIFESDFDCLTDMVERNMEDVLFGHDELEKAAKARAAFKDGQYSEAIQILKELQSKKPNDFRIKHNLALCIYALSGKAKTTEFQSKLNSLETERKETKEPTLVLKYNQAVILFHQQQFQKSIDILNELKKKIREEPPQTDDFELKLLALTGECYLNLRNPQSTIMVADEMDKLTDNDGFRNVVQSLYARSYILSLSVGHSRPKTPSNKAIKGFTRNSGNLSAFIKSAFEVRRNNFPKALKVIAQDQIEINGNVHQTGDSIRSMYFNNLAIIFYKMKKYTLSSLYMIKASQANDEDLRQLPRIDSQWNGRPLVTLGMSKKSNILRNLGVIKLFAGQHQDAFELLIKSVESHFDCSRAWLRIAEAIIANYCKKCRPVECKPIISEIGEGTARLVIAECGSDEFIEPTVSESEMNDPVMCLEYGASCIRNAEVLLPKRSDGPDYHKLCSSILLAGAFIALKLRRYSQCAEYSRKCKAIAQGKTDWDPKSILLSDLYLGEAYIHLDMIEDAIECYKSAIQATSSTSTLDFTNHVTFDSEQYNAKTVLLNNLAASFAIQTDYEKARKQLQHITELIPSDLISQKTILLAVYILLKEGKKDLALQILRTRNLSLFKYSQK